MPKADSFFGLDRILEGHPTLRTFIIWLLLTGALVYGCLWLADGAEVELEFIEWTEMNSTEELQYLLGNVYGFEAWDLDEKVVLVGVAWGYNVSRDGVVTLDDGATLCL